MNRLTRESTVAGVVAALSIGSAMACGPAPRKPPPRGAVQVCYWQDQAVEQRCDTRICATFTNQWGDNIPQHVAYCQHANGDNRRVFGCGTRLGESTVPSCASYAPSDPRFPAPRFSAAPEHEAHPESWVAAFRLKP